MAKMLSKKFKKKATWKPVEISGNFITDDFEGFAGLEVLENYDQAFLTGDYSRNGNDFSVSELDSDIFDTTAIKRRYNEDDDNEIEENTKILSKHKRHKVENAKKEKITDNKSKDKSQKIEFNNTPGKYVLLKSVSMEDDERCRLDQVVKNWGESVSGEIAQALVDLNFMTPTEIQRQAVHAAVCAGNDILGAAPTGSGKTLAFGIPVVQGAESILAASTKHDEDLFAIILTPTRELAQQIYKHLLAISKYTRVRISCIIGGLAVVKQERILKSNPHIVVGTPGRIWELYQEGNAHMQKLTKIKYLVVDETDRMVEKGHFAELENLLKVMNVSKDCERSQTFVFSATLSLIHMLPEYLRKSQRKKQGTVQGKLKELELMFGMKNPKIIDCTNVKGVAENLVECRILCSSDEKDFYLYYILMNHPGRTIVFCNSIDCVKRNASVLTHLNLEPIMLHGKMEQKQRLKNLENFKENENSLLVATQVAARGLDISNVQHVVHYQVPTTTEDYVHRSGRTARANKDGLSVLIMDQSEVKYFVRLQKTLGRNADMPTFPINSKILYYARERVRLARDIENLDLQARRQNDSRNWKKKAAEDIGILESSEESGDESSNNRIQKQLILAIKQKKIALGKLLSMNIVSNNDHSLMFSTDVISADSTPIEKVKKILDEKKARNIKLYKTKRKM